MSADANRFNFDLYLEKILADEHQRGRNDEHKKIEIIKGWLTRQPQRKWASEILEWIEKMETQP